MKALRNWWLWAAILGAGVVVALVAGPPPGGRPLDPGSTGGQGTKALVDSLRELGAGVQVTSQLPGAGTTAALVLQDGMDDADRRALAGWVRGGGTLVVADPSSPLVPFPRARSFRLGVVEERLPRRCDVPALRAVGHVHAPGNVRFHAPEGATDCFTGDDGSWLVLRSEGRGNLVAVGGTGAWTNAQLGKDDNGLLAVTLLAPGRASRVQVFPLPAPGAGRRGLVDLVSPRVKLALVQLAVAFVVLALWRARRLGRPVLEPAPVEIPGSELVVAVGRLLQRGRGRGRAAQILRRGLRRSLGERLGLPASASPEQVAESAAGRGGLSVAELTALLDGPEPADERQLVELAQSVERVREEVTGAG